MEVYAISDDEFPSQIMELAVITKPESNDPEDICPSCVSTTRALNRKGIVYREVPSNKIPEHLKRKIEALNLKAIPVLVADDDIILSAGGVQYPTIAKIKSALAPAS